MRSDEARGAGRSTSRLRACLRKLLTHRPAAMGASVSLPIDADVAAAPDVSGRQSPAQAQADELIHSAVFLSSLVPVIEAAGELPSLPPDAEQARDRARQSFAELALRHLGDLVQLSEAVGLDLEAAGRSYLQRAKANLS